MIFYFSGTGNSKWIAGKISQGQKDQLIFIPEALRNNAMEYHLSENESVGFVFPVYSWGPPPIVLQFIHNLILRSDRVSYLYFVCSCGDDTGLTQQVFCKAVADKRWHCSAGFSVIMPNNYILLPGFDVDPRAVADKKRAEAVVRLEEINRLIAEKRTVYQCKEGAFPFIKTRLINPLFVRWGMDTKKFHAMDSCVGCKRCEKACPVGNISVNRKPIWGDHCTSCLACYHVCPNHAVAYGKSTLKKGQYFHPERVLL